MQPNVFEPRRYLSSRIYTFESLTDHPEPIIEFVESTFLLAEPFGPAQTLSCQIEHRDRISSRKFTPRAWRSCKEQLRHGLLGFAITSRNTFDAPETAISRWGVNFTSVPELNRKRGVYRKGVPLWKRPFPSELKVAVEIPLAVDRVTPDLQTKIATLARSTFVAVGASYGFIQWSSRPDISDDSWTSFEERRNLTAYETAYLLNHRVRGGFWENYLTRAHIKILGGIRALKMSAPCARVDDVIGGKAWALRLTDDINDFSSEDIRVLEEYFEPLSPNSDEAKPKS